MSGFAGARHHLQHRWPERLRAAHEARQALLHRRAAPCRRTENAIRLASPGAVFQSRNIQMDEY